MRDRSSLGALLLTCLLVPMIGCGNPQGLDSIQVTPSTQALAVGQTAQFVATGIYGNASHSSTKAITSGVTWSSSAPAVATVNATSGLATAVGAGTASITASADAYSGPVVNTATLTVTAPSGGIAAEQLLSITVLPATISDSNLLGTGQFLAYGTFATAPTVMDITNGINHNGFVAPVTWVSGAQTIFPISSSGAPGSTGGLVTAVGSGTDNIYAVAANPDGTIVYSPSVTFNCPYVAYTPGTPGNPSANPPVPPTQAVLGSCNEETIASGLLVTLTVFNAGLDTTNWLVTAPSATGTPNVIQCGPGAPAGASICTATYPLGATVTLTATQTPGSTGTFGGWSWNCTPTVPVTAGGPNKCTVTLGTSDSSNESVGAIFN